ncbi:MAG TPA: hypothetical protein PLT48_04765 [Nitrospira sp.]|nr:hypothetical protein [Nitrospira sp.]
MREAYAHTLPSPTILSVFPPPNPVWQSLNNLCRMLYNAPHEIRRATNYRGGMMMTRLRVGVVVLSLSTLVVAAPMGYALADGGHVKETIKHAKEGVEHEKEAIKHLEESVKASNDPHAKEALEHAKEAVKHAEESLAHAEQASSNKGKGKK